ncbi:Protein of unknown function [Gryllus bimaculatus]|nr:Protein of unknown function [Gryllus bimaculatus]
MCCIIKFLLTFLVCEEVLYCFTAVFANTVFVKIFNLLESYAKKMNYLFLNSVRDTFWKTVLCGFVQQHFCCCKLLASTISLKYFLIYYIYIKSSFMSNPGIFLSGKKIRKHQLHFTNMFLSFLLFLLSYDTLVEESMSKMYLAAENNWRHFTSIPSWGTF